LKVIEALEDGIGVDGPTGKVLIDPKTHHCSRGAFIAECREQRFKVFETFENQFAADTSVVCDLEVHPDDNTQHKIKIWRRLVEVGAPAD
jgi:branched-chain amino acid transport system substrate-binding protein